MIIVLASIRVKPGMRSEFLEIFKSNVPNVKGEPGCLDYLPAIDFKTDIQAQQCDEQVVTVVEKWQDYDALLVHFQAPHMLEYRQRVKDLVEGVSLKILQEA